MTSSKPWFALPDQPDLDEAIVIVGAGLAGCHTAFELAKRNIKVRLIDAGNSVASGASGNTIAIVKPYITRSTSQSNAYYKAAYHYLLNQLEHNEEINKKSEFNRCGILQIVDQTYPDHLDYERCDSKRASELAGLPIHSDALYFAQGGHINPLGLCQSVTNHPNIELLVNTPIRNIKRFDAHWLLDTANNAESIRCKTLVLANGQSLNAFSQTQTLPITAARGQTSCFKLSETPSAASKHKLNTVITDKHYIVPDKNNVVVGATFKRDIEDTEISDSDHAENLNALNTLLPSLRVSTTPSSGFCGIRATTPDRFPIVGPMPDIEAYKKDYERIKDGLPPSNFSKAVYQHGLYIIGGFGSRGVVSAPYCAKLLAEHICSKQSNVEPAHVLAETKTSANTEHHNKQNHPAYEENHLAHWEQLIHPARFLIRALKRA